MFSFYILLLAGAALAIAHFFHIARKPGLRDIPGPWLAKFTNLYRVGMIMRGRYSDELAELHHKYGSMVRTGPDCVSLTDRRAVSDIYGLRTNFPKSDWVKSSQTLYQGKVVPALMTTQDKQYHSALKRSIASAYSVTSLSGYEGSVEEIIGFFLKRLDELFVQSGPNCPFDKWLQWYAYDVIGVITMSRPMGLLEKGEDVDNMLQEIRTEGEYRAVGAVMPIIDWMWRKNALMTRFTSPTHKIMVRAKSMLAARLDGSNATNEQHRDFIYRFLEAKGKHPDTLGERNMLGFVGSNLQAGSDTTAVVLRTIMYQVAKDPAVLERIRKELDAPDTKYPIPFQQAFNDFPYLDAVIQESLRYFPPVALQLERMVPEGGYELPNGPFLPSGTKVGMFGHTMHLDKSIYGDDAEIFNPDRWLPRKGETQDEHAERYRVMKACDMSFGHGQRRCIGVHVAELQIYKLIPALVGLLDIELANPNKAMRVEQKFFALQSGLDVTLKWRPGKSLNDYAVPT